MLPCLYCTSLLMWVRGHAMLYIYCVACVCGYGQMDYSEVGGGLDHCQQLVLLGGLKSKHSGCEEVR